MLWAFAREGGVPGSQIISRVRSETSQSAARLLLTDFQVETRFTLPIWSIITTSTIAALLALIIIGSTTAFNAFTNLTVAGFYSTFMVAASVMLHKRLTTPADKIDFGPFRLGRAGVPLTIVALIYSLIGFFFSFWPNTADVTAQTFNWSLVVYWGTIFLAMLWWIIRARHYYTGPKRETSI